jgi:hypothetical protein
MCASSPATRRHDRGDDARGPANGADENGRWLCDDERPRSDGECLASNRRDAGILVVDDISNALPTGDGGVVALDKVSFGVMPANSWP